MSKINVNTVDTQCGSTLTLGSSGKTVTLATGASQSGFGRTGTVNWCTTAKTSPFTAVSGDGYFVNTTSGSVTVTLPASPSAGDIVAIADYAGTAGCNAIIIGRNGSKFQGTCNCGAVNEEREAVTLVYVDGTQGWQSVGDNTENKVNKQYIQATGGTVSTCGDFKIHTFTSDSAFCVSATGNSAGSNAVDYLVVAGGGSGGHFIGAGGGAGGFRVSNSYSTPAPTMSPLSNPTGITVTAQSYPVTVGAGAAFKDSPATIPQRQGSNSVFSTITSAGGGGGGFFPAEPGSPVPKGVGAPGGSGGGGDYNCAAGGFPNGNPGGTGNTPPVSPPQGNTGGAGFAYPGSGTAAPGGGGGAGAVGGPGPQAGTVGNGGIGSFVASTGFGGCNGTTGPVPNVRYFAGGGGGGGYTGSSGGCGGAGGGGTGATNPNNPPALNGVANTGGGGGGEGGHPSPGPAGGTGGSGIVIIRYKFQN